jgi:hypothetical protein
MRSYGLLFQAVIGVVNYVKNSSLTENLLEKLCDDMEAPIIM